MVDQSIYDEEYYISNCEGYTIDGTAGDRLQSVISFIPHNANKILDLGCGRGEVAKTLTDKDVLSIDFSLASSKIFYENNSMEKSFIRHDLSYGLKWLRSEYFDAIIIADVIEHINDIELIILVYDVIRVLRINGKIIIDTPIIDKSNASKYHVNLKESIVEVLSLFSNTEDSIIELEYTKWYKEPEHCNIVLRKVDR